MYWDETNEISMERIIESDQASRAVIANNSNMIRIDIEENGNWKKWDDIITGHGPQNLPRLASVDTPYCIKIPAEMAIEYNTNFMSTKKLASYITEKIENMIHDSDDRGWLMLSDKKYLYVAWRNKEEVESGMELMFIPTYHFE